MAIGTVGGLTSLHPMAKFSLNLLQNPGAPELMQIASTMGLANNFSALKSLTTKGIQVGHMKMHLLNILNVYKATEEEKVKAIEYFKSHKVSHNEVAAFMHSVRLTNPKH
jgi:hydroxymethylglutaryl-CoA reductase